MSERIYQVIIGVLVLVVLVGGWLMIAAKRAKPSTTMTTQLAASTTDSEIDSDADAVVSKTSGKTSTATTKNTTVATGNEISVADQAAGKSVSVESVTLTKRSWVAVQDNKDWTLGAQRLEAGTAKDVSVALLRATVKGQTYKAVIYVDNGDGKFDIHKDTLVTKADGSVLSSAFIAK
jgi:hypothetical protein